jgi:RNA polymerase sigma-70 factor (ECF subfamily)
LVERYQGVATRLAAAMCGPDGAQDAAQEAFVKAWHALPRFRDGKPFRPWILAITANEARNARRAAGRRSRLALRSAASDATGDAPSAEEAAEVARRRAVVLAAVEMLTDADRDVIACRYFAELSEAETAAALACRPGTVKSRLSRALVRLRAHIDALGELALDDGVTHG